MFDGMIYDAILIYDMLFLAFFSFDPCWILWNCETDQPTNRKTLVSRCEDGSKDMHQPFYGLPWVFVLKNRRFPRYFMVTYLPTDGRIDGRTDRWSDRPYRDKFSSLLTKAWPTSRPARLIWVVGREIGNFSALGCCVSRLGWLGRSVGSGAIMPHCVADGQTDQPTDSLM